MQYSVNECTVLDFFARVPAEVQLEVWRFAIWVTIGGILLSG